MTDVVIKAIRQLQILAKARKSYGELLQPPAITSAGARNFSNLALTNP